MYLISKKVLVDPVSFRSRVTPFPHVFRPVHFTELISFPGRCTRRREPLQTRSGQKPT